MKAVLACATGMALFLGLCGCGSSASTEDVNPTPQATSYEQYDAMFADWASRYIECARKYGADARLLNGGSIDQPYAPGRPVKDGLDAACVEEVGESPLPPPLTDSFLAGLYELYVVEAKCLREHGYTISEPPSRKDWVENYGGNSWFPLVEILNNGGDAEKADGLCPQPDPREAEELGATLGGD
ncbi:MAG: hypothetical protein KF742_03180 [Cryobacterium sp.]|nr:hypothetical protein [Cryobacterium sp.]MBX3090574.1 hypothetical protein [Cryobacterium sp.]MBX3116287.1 hypothetical protein [Cryobacterium sp.]MCO5293965.1 hypothetical protein [Homoserinimonas sp.]